MGVFRRNSGSGTNTPRGVRASAPSSQAPASLFNTPSGYAPSTRPAYNQPRPLTAAAAKINLSDKNEALYLKQRQHAGSSLWQSQVWEFYDTIGEIKYAFTLVASVVSRIRLYAAVITNPAEAPTAIGDVADFDQRVVDAAERALGRLNSAYGGHAGLLRDAALNLSVTGECYLVQVPARLGSGLPESWDIRSTDELQIDGKGNYFLTPRRELRNGAMTQGKPGVIPLPPSAFVGRIWRSHPRYSEEADSSMRAVVDLCNELLLLNRTFRSTARSRLNSGALYLPDGLSVAANADPDYPYDASDADYQQPNYEEYEDEFEDQLIDAMTTPLKDEDSASAVVPLIIRGPAELGDKIKQFKFERSFDPMLAERADRVLDRILQGIDVPKDVITGLANVKYSNALQIDESLYKAHIEPLMLLIADSLTVVYLRPYLLANGFTEAEVERVVVWYDPAAIATRNDRAQDADAGFDKMAVSFETWRRTHGFSDADAPSPDEVALRMMISKGALSPELTQAMLQAVAPGVMDSVRDASQSMNPAPEPDSLTQALGGAPATPEEAPASAPASPETAPPLAEPTAPAPTPTITPTQNPE